MSTIDDRVSKEQTAKLASLQEAFDRGYEKQNQERQRARRALIELLKQPASNSEAHHRESPIETVAQAQKLHPEEVHLALDSLFADGIAYYGENFEVSIDDTKLSSE